MPLPIFFMVRIALTSCPTRARLLSIATLTEIEEDWLTEEVAWAPRVMQFEAITTIIVTEKARPRILVISSSLDRRLQTSLPNRSFSGRIVGKPSVAYASSAPILWELIASGRKPPGFRIVMDGLMPAPFNTRAIPPTGKLFRRKKSHISMARCGAPAIPRTEKLFAREMPHLRREMWCASTVSGRWRWRPRIPRRGP